MQLFGNWSFLFCCLQDLLGRTRAVLSPGPITPHYWSKTCVLHPEFHESCFPVSPVGIGSAPCFKWAPDVVLRHSDVFHCLEQLLHMNACTNRTQLKTCKVGGAQCCAYFWSYFSAQLSPVPQSLATLVHWFLWTLGSVSSTWGAFQLHWCSPALPCSLETELEALLILKTDLIFSTTVLCCLLSSVLKLYFFMHFMVWWFQEG